MMKKLAVLLTLLLVVTSVAVAGCGRSEPNTGALPRAVLHVLDVRFENCNVCHVNDQLSVTSIPHADFTNDMCTQSGCHGKPLYTEPNTTSPISRPIPHIVTYPLDNCIACHIPSETGYIIPHGDFTDNSSCLLPACHVTLSGVPPTTTTTTTPPPPINTDEPPTTPGPTGPPDPGGAPVLEKAALPLTSPNHSAATASMCVACHMPGAGNDYPMTPTWAGSAATPGPWTITAGSDADHTGRTDAPGCVVAGCHAKNW